MATHFTATVIEGQLRLDQPLDLPDHSKVVVTVESPSDWREKYLKGLEEWRKLIEEHPINSGGVRFTREELHERR
jgi:hypothetical protein